MYTRPEKIVNTFPNTWLSAMTTPRMLNNIDEMINTSRGGRAPWSAILPYTNN